MHKLITLLICLLLFLPISFADTWDDFSDVDRMWDGQKTITNQEFEQVMDALEAKEKKKEEKKRKKIFKRIGGGGTSLHTELNPENNISEIDAVKPKEEGFLINVPVNIILDSNILERGYYKVIGSREDNEVFINFYQSQFLKGKVKATETQNDYDEKNVDFAKILPYNNSFVQLIFGSLDFNAYAYLPYQE